jgi:thiol-disulfide isomerase/thioredoxin
LHALLLALTLSAATGPTFIEDDFSKALKTAKAQKKLLFVDAWAPWCHTCLSMQREVLEQPALGALADRVEFVAVDADAGAVLDAALRAAQAALDPALADALDAAESADAAAGFVVMRESHFPARGINTGAPVRSNGPPGPDAIASPTR